MKRTRVNYTSGSRSLDALADGPLTDLVGTGGKEGSQVEGLAHGGDHLGQSRLGVEVLALLEGLLFGLEARETLLEGDGDGNERVTGRVGLDPLKDLGEVLVLLADVVALAQVDQVDHGLGGEKHQGVDGFDLTVVSLCGHKTCSEYKER